MVLSGRGSPEKRPSARTTGAGRTCRLSRPAAGSPPSAGRAAYTGGAWMGRARQASPPGSTPCRRPSWKRPAWTARHCRSAGATAPGRRRCPHANPDKPLFSSRAGRTISLSPGALRTRSTSRWHGLRSQDPRSRSASTRAAETPYQQTSMSPPRTAGRSAPPPTLCGRASCSTDGSPARSPTISAGPSTRT